LTISIPQHLILKLNNDIVLVLIVSWDLVELSVSVSPYDERMWTYLVELIE
jgi:hypothetical protein